MKIDQHALIILRFVAPLGLKVRLNNNKSLKTNDMLMKKTTNMHYVGGVAAFSTRPHRSQ